MRPKSPARSRKSKITVTCLLTVPLRKPTIPISCSQLQLREYRVPRGPLCGALARGEDVTLEDSTLVRSADVCKPLAPLKKIVVLGDTSDASNIADLARGCCALVHEATFDASMREMAIDRGERL